MLNPVSFSEQKKWHFSLHPCTDLGPVSRKSRERFGPGNLFCVHLVRIHDQSLNNFENDVIIKNIYMLLSH